MSPQMYKSVNKYIGIGLALFCVNVSYVFAKELIIAPPKDRFIHCADAESFALLPNDFSRFTQTSGEDGLQFKNVLERLGKPALRLASMQRWDWRGEAESNALVSSEYFQEVRKAWGLSGRQKAINYHYLSAKQYFEYSKANGVSSIPMLDVRFFFDSKEGKVKKTADNLKLAATQYAAGYAKFVIAGNYKILFWEIGNEEYLSQYKFSPNEYAAVVKAYIDAVRQVDPSAKFGIQLATWLPEWKNWSQQVLQNLKGYENYISYANFHHYAPWYFTDVEIANEMTFLSNLGFKNTKLAITEWRPTARANIDDQFFKSASAFSRHFMFMVRQPDIEMACVHSFPLFGGLAEWSDGTRWTSYSGMGIGRKDPIGRPRWRILPFGTAQKMIIDVMTNSHLYAYSEDVGKLSYYQFNKIKGGNSLVVINESASAVEGKIIIKSSSLITSIRGEELFSENPNAIPKDTEPQPWSVKPITIGQSRADLSSGSVVSLGSSNAVQVRLRPFSVVTLELR